MGVMSSPTAGPDVSVRVGWADDAAGIAQVQVAAWQQEYAGLLPTDVVASFDVEEFAARWHQALTRPADARLRVLVALDRNTVRGFAVTGPSPDPDSDPVADGELTELVVDPGHGRAGHGSRLLQASVDTLRADRFTRAVTWLTSSDDARRTFLTGAGWAPDGAHRELDLHGDGSVLVKQVRLHTDLRED
jgi:GNAT superfamily N-acetyltransferase